MQEAINSMMKLLFRPCPICMHIYGVILHQLRFTLPGGVSLPDQYNLVSCENCGFTFANTSADQKAYDSFYAEQSKYEDATVSSGGTTSAWDRERFHRVADHLASFVSGTDSTILDVGCANGGLLLALREKGFTNLAGLDPSEKCVANVIDMGIKAKRGGIYSGDVAPGVSGRYDCLILSHVLEHLRDLGGAMAWASRQVSCGGLIYVEVPDASRYAEYYKIPYYYFDCEHINHFDPVSLVNLFRSVGFALCDMRQKDIPTSPEDRYPVIAAIFYKLPVFTYDGPILSCGARKGIEAYLQLSSDDDVYQIIDNLADGGEDLMIWGAGQYALRLLSATRLIECRITAFIDKDKRKQGMTLGNIPIRAPEALYEHGGPVVVCSALHSAEISDEIRKMGHNNRIVVLKGTLRTFLGPTC
ncbi:MAG: class I SAM-dependent methyltransferase [Geobacteraceae bacterium]|nr:class I SAM-dependent methyltransferase [Geobacteraceae bacterium]